MSGWKVSQFATFIQCNSSIWLPDYSWFEKPFQTDEPGTVFFRLTGSQCSQWGEVGSVTVL